MNPENRWVKLAELIPWDIFEEKYADFFPSDTGNVAKPLRMALGALIIQTKFQYPDRELIDQIAENPYLQYFIGLPGFQEEPPFDASTLVLFRKRITSEMLIEANNYILNHKDDDNPPPTDSGSGNNGSTPSNKGTLTLDATAAPVNIRYPQDVSLLNEAREKLETIIYRFCKAYDLSLPRRYKKEARKAYLDYAKSKKRSIKKVRRAIKKQLQYVKRDIGYLEGFMADGYAPTPKECSLLYVIFNLYEQQKYMYDNKTHIVADRIVSLSQPWIRPIVRGKIKAPTEFGAKLDLSLDTEGYARIEKLSFNPYNESSTLQEAVERYKERTGYYPERVLADQIYRTRENRSFCKERGIRLSGPKLGRPSIDTKVDKKQEYQDNTDRIAVEREFSLDKRCYGMGCIVTKLEETQLTSIALSVFVSNLFKIRRRILYALFKVFQILVIIICWLCPATT